MKRSHSLQNNIQLSGFQCVVGIPKFSVPGRTSSILELQEQIFVLTIGFVWGLCWQGVSFGHRTLTMLYTHPAGA